MSKLLDLPIGITHSDTPWMAESAVTGKAVLQCMNCAEVFSLRWRDREHMEDLIKIYKSCPSCAEINKIIHIRSHDTSIW